MYLYKFLDSCIKLNNLEKLLSFILKNYKLFDDIKKLEDEFNIEKFKINIYNNSEDDKNIMLMFRILEKHFYDKLSKIALRNLRYEDELNNDKSKSKYLVFATDNLLSFDILKVYLLFYYVNLKLYDNKKYLGLDFEFNTKVVAMMQINFEQPRLDLYKYSLIFLFHPNQFTVKWKYFFVNKILCNDVYKILHGSDALDIPYVYNDLLSENPKLIKKFNKYFIDTKFLCEYKFYENNQELGKCKIYHVLLNENIISQKVYDKLLENEKQMGPIYDIYIDINRLNENLIDYTLYDVLFLSHLVEKLQKDIKSFKLINELTQLTFIDKRKIIDIIPKLEINKINNFIIYIKKPYRLNDLFNLFLNKIKENIKIDKILKINYFKLTLIMIFKYEFFIYAVNKYDIYEKLSEKIKYTKTILSYKSDYLDKINTINIINDVKKYIHAFFSKY